MTVQIKLPDGGFLRDIWDEPMDFLDAEKAQAYILERWKGLYPETRALIEIVEVREFMWNIPSNLLFAYKEIVDVLPHAIALKEAMDMAEKLGQYRHFQSILTHVAKFPNNRNVVVDLYPYHDWNHHFSFDWCAYDKYDSARKRIMNGGIIFFEPQGFVLPDKTFDITVKFAEHEGWHVCT